jgi:hypothetical protein
MRWATTGGNTVPTTITRMKKAPANRGQGHLSKQFQRHPAIDAIAPST